MHFRKDLEEEVGANTNQRVPFFLCNGKVKRK